MFDAFKARLQESNSKVNLYALESLQEMVRLLKDDLSGVVNLLVPAIVDNHLNSKNRAVYSAATGALCELVLNLGEGPVGSCPVQSERGHCPCCYSCVLLFPSSDSSLLLQPFCTKALFLSGQAKVDLILKVAGMLTDQMLLLFFAKLRSAPQIPTVHQCVAK